MSHYEPPNARVSLDFVIVGTSIAGLACAYAFRQAGHDVHVLEAEEELNQACVFPSPI